MELDAPFPEMPEAGELPSTLADLTVDDFADAVLMGLGKRPRSIPCRFFYDARGSELFERITRLAEYYPTRTETALLATYGKDIAERVGADPVLVEFGAGSGRKTRLLIDAIADLSLYIPIDISAPALEGAAKRLRTEKPGLSVVPLVADFTQALALPLEATGRERLGFFSGSTIGNFTRREAKAFLARAATLLGHGSSFLVGVDLKKDESLLLPAYDDCEGITAAFNLNLLRRINRELKGNFDLGKFAHHAIYNEAKGRVEMYLVSLAEQTVTVLGRRFKFHAGESLHTENSHKYSVSEFQKLARSAGWQPTQVWTDSQKLFSLHLLKQ